MPSADTGRSPSLHPSIPAQIQQTRPVVKNVIRLHVPSSFKKMVDLPDPAIWNKAKYTTEFYDLLTVRIRQCGYLFNRDSDWKTLRCVLTPKGYFIIYEKDKDLKGKHPLLLRTQRYAVNLHTATKLSMKSRSKFDGPQSGSSLKKENCLVTLKWAFGSVAVDLTDKQVSRWRRAILDAYEGANLTYSEKAQNKCVGPTACISIDLHCRVVVETEYKEEDKEPSTSSSGSASGAMSDSSVPSASSASLSHCSLQSNRDAPTSDYLADVSSTLDRLDAFERQQRQLTLANTGFPSSDDTPSDVRTVPEEPISGGRFEVAVDPSKGAKKPPTNDSLDTVCALEKSSVTSIRTTTDDLTSARGTLRNIKQRRTSAVCVAKYGKTSVVEPEDIVKCMVLRNTPSNTTLHSFPRPSLSQIPPNKSSSSENSSTSSEPLTVIPRAREETKAEEAKADHFAPTAMPSAVHEALKRFRAKGLQLTQTQRKQGCAAASKVKELATPVDQEQHRPDIYVSKRRLQLRNDTASTVSSSSTCTTTDGNEYESRA